MALISLAFAVVTLSGCLRTRTGGQRRRRRKRSRRPRGVLRRAHPQRDRPHHRRPGQARRDRHPEHRRRRGVRASRPPGPRASACRSPSTTTGRSPSPSPAARCKGCRRGSSRPSTSPRATKATGRSTPRSTRRGSGRSCRRSPPGSPARSPRSTRAPSSCSRPPCRARCCAPTPTRSTAGPPRWNLDADAGPQTFTMESEPSSLSTLQKILIGVGALLVVGFILVFMTAAGSKRHHRRRGSQDQGPDQHARRTGRRPGRPGRC
jgi:hypothetical protein